MSATSTYHVGHLNVALLRADWDSPVVAGFVDGLAQVNALAERSPGFVAHVGGEEFEAQIDAHDHPLTENPRFAATLSVWENAATLDHFVHKTLHGAFLRRREEWFEKIEKPSYVVWPVKADHIPDFAEGMARLNTLAANGPTDAAYDLEWAREREAEVG